MGRKMSRLHERVPEVRIHHAKHVRGINDASSFVEPVGIVGRRPLRFLGGLLAEFRARWSDYGTVVARFWCRWVRSSGPPCVG